MSWYTNFYVAFQTKDGMIYPYGPFDYSGDYKCIHWTSRSFTTELKDYFEPIEKEKLSVEMIHATFGLDIEDINDYLPQFWGICPLDALPKGDFIKSGYYLIDDIEKYRNNYDPNDLFYEKLDCTSYAMKLENELKFGKPTEITDEWGNKYTPHSCSDFSYFCYPDYCCKEYESFKIQTIVRSMYEDYYAKKVIPENSKIVIFKTEG